MTGIYATAMKIITVLDLLYDTFDTFTDAQYTFFLYNGHHWVWGSISFISSAIGLFIILSKLPCCGYLYALKQYTLNDVTMSSENADPIEMLKRYTDLFWYLIIYKWPEGIPMAVIRVVAHDPNDKMNFFLTAGVITTIFDNISVLFVVVPFFVKFIRDEDLRCFNCVCEMKYLIVAACATMICLCSILLVYLFKLLYPPVFTMPLVMRIVMYLALLSIYVMFFYALNDAQKLFTATEDKRRKTTLGEVPGKTMAV